MFAGRTCNFAAYKGEAGVLIQTISSEELAEPKGVLQSAPEICTGTNFQLLHKFKSGFHSPAPGIRGLTNVTSLLQGTKSFLISGVTPPLFLLNRSLLI
jgi:hypothetical protein